MEKTRKTYKSNSKSFSIGGFQPEQRLANGNIVRGDVDIKFTNYLYSTDDPKAQKHIEDSVAFKGGEVCLIPDGVLGSLKDSVKVTETVASANG